MIMLTHFVYLTLLIPILDGLATLFHFTLDSYISTATEIYYMTALLVMISILKEESLIRITM